MTEIGLGLKKTGDGEKNTSIEFFSDHLVYSPLALKALKKDLLNLNHVLFKSHHKSCCLPFQKSVGFD